MSTGTSDDTNNIQTETSREEQEREASRAGKEANSIWHGANYPGKGTGNAAPSHVLADPSSRK